MANLTIEWKPVSGFEDYEISNEGAIRRIHIIAVSEKNGFLRTSLRDKNGKRHDVMIHVAVAKAFLQPLAEEMHRVRHRDKNRRNNKPSNLYWVDKKIRKAVRDSYKKRKASLPYSSKLPDYSDQDV